ncbi:MAG: flagellar biosynthesis protein FlhB [Comamonas sp.]
MADDSDLEKTEPASPHRLQKAREEGQVARSRELATFLILLTGALGLWLCAGWLYAQLGGAFRHGLGFERAAAMDPAFMLSAALLGVWHALLGVLPVLGLLAVAALAGSIALGGLVFSGQALAFKFERLDPVSGLGRLFSMNALAELFKAVAKCLLVGGVAAWAIWHQHGAALSLMNAAPTAALAASLQIVAGICAAIIASLLLIVGLDVPWQVFSHLKKLRMSRQDLKQEHKENEGDPHVKGRIRQQQHAAARRRMMSQVPKADVVVTNPAHFAVALRYEEGRGNAPRVVAKGRDQVAARIREIATEARVPILEAPPLARALHQHVELEQEVPASLYTAVAQVLAWVFQLRAWRGGAAGPEPIPPAALPVPAGLDPLTAQAVSPIHD